MTTAYSVTESTIDFILAWPGYSYSLVFDSLPNLVDWIVMIIVRSMTMHGKNLMRQKLVDSIVSTHLFVTVTAQQCGTVTARNGCL